MHVMQQASFARGGEHFLRFYFLIMQLLDEIFKKV